MAGFTSCPDSSVKLAIARVVSSLGLREIVAGGLAVRVSVV